ncbi:permuted papain-like amidase enzyme, yaeF/YiiX, c92 family domain-containing protein [Ditylenchus destructor]|uniref:Permuted papain-like amidase enzyme, yaeF/YiiX, c92 family domain-containing protein n=1 Tax=Ditylenchus destructor TaxID=166010 RepID=A0AAD4MGR9_9BILA|nr:permuted papain-like amidase enzyme, yaeF/YiiX, c92 family domain-containing protein [Ditylenchus destructor]
MLINNKAGKTVFERPKAERFADKAARPMMINNKAGNTVFEQSKAERLTDKAAGGISIQEIESAATAKLSPGDLVFFMKIPKDDFTAGIISCSEGDSNVYHVAIVVKDDKSSHLTVMHTLPATGVERVTLVEAIRKLKPGMVEIARMDVDEEWKNRAAEWAAEQEGLEYNDLFSVWL